MLQATGVPRNQVMATKGSPSFPASILSRFSPPKTGIRLLKAYTIGKKLTKGEEIYLLLSKQRPEILPLDSSCCERLVGSCVCVMDPPPHHT